MSISETINTQIQEAMKSKDQDRLRALRSIKSALLLVATEGANKGVTDELAIKAIQKLAKQRKDSIESFEKNNRKDLADKEKSELSVLEEFLPEELSESEITAIIQEVIQETGAAGMKDFGKVMPLAIKKAAGRADGSIISSILKKILSA